MTYKIESTTLDSSKMICFIIKHLCGKITGSRHWSKVVYRCQFRDTLEPVRLMTKKGTRNEKSIRKRTASFHPRAFHNPVIVSKLQKASTGLETMACVCQKQKMRNRNTKTSVACLRVEELCGTRFFFLGLFYVLNY